MLYNKITNPQQIESQRQIHDKLHNASQQQIEVVALGPNLGHLQTVANPDISSNLYWKGKNLHR